MGYKCSFMDNELYSAQDINARFSVMFTEGVILGDCGNVLSDLNLLTENIVTEGVCADSCRVMKTEEGFLISQGGAIMGDGSGIFFDSEGYTFTAPEGVHSYVYLKRNEPENTIDVVVGQEEPDGDYVPLAVIAEDGSVIDRRKYAMLKMPSPQASTLRNLTHQFHYLADYQGETFDFGAGNFSYIIVWDSVFESGGKDIALHPTGKCIRPIADGEEIFFQIEDNMGNIRLNFFAKKNGNVLEVRVVSSYNYGVYTMNFAVI